MKIFFLLALFCAFLSNAKAQNTDTSTALTKIFIVRHADRLPTGDSLSAIGTARALELKRVLGDVAFNQIFSTNTSRTRNTAKPLADAKGLPIALYTDNNDFIRQLEQEKKGNTILVVGHSNTLGDLMRKCGCSPPTALNALPETQYDNLFLVTLQRRMVNGKPISTCEFLQLKYGMPTN